MNLYPLTQKGKGIVELAFNAFNYLNKYIGAERVQASIYRTSDLFDDCYESGLVTFPKFVRPCPLVPRHGFVDSRVVNNIEELDKVARETYAEDESSEIVLMEPIEASHSAILQEGRITIGPGNDGATAGHDSLSFFLRGNGHLSSHSLVWRAGVRTSPYVEIVYGVDWSGEVNVPFCVQLRDGPKLPQSIDNVPEDMVVESILIVMNEDLLTWEKIIKGASPNTVVYHPDGSLSSHYSIHAVTAGIPVMISRAPVLGETLLKTKDAECPAITWDDLRSAFYAAMVDKIEMKEAMLFVLAVSKLVKSPDSYLLGYAMGLAFRLSLTACIGEERHFDRVRKQDRDKVFARVWKAPVNHKRKTKHLYTNFMTSCGWPGDGYGGAAWASITLAAHNMFNAIVEMNDTNVLFEFNKLVDAHHNNDWFGSKFISSDDFKAASEGYYPTVTKSGPLMYKVMKSKRFHDWRWKALPNIAEIIPFKIKKALKAMKEAA